MENSQFLVKVKATQLCKHLTQYTVALSSTSKCYVEVAYHKIYYFFHSLSSLIPFEDNSIFHYVCNDLPSPAILKILFIEQQLTTRGTA